MLRSGSESHVKGLVQREVETPEFCNFSLTSNCQGRRILQKLGYNYPKKNPAKNGQYSGRLHVREKQTRKNSQDANFSTNPIPKKGKCMSSCPMSIHPVCIKMERRQGRGRCSAGCGECTAFKSLPQLTHSPLSMETGAKISACHRRAERVHQFDRHYIAMQVLHPVCHCCSIGVSECREQHIRKKKAGHCFCYI